MNGQRALLTQIKSWVGRIDEDIRTIPEFRAVEEMGSMMSEIEERLKEFRVHGAVFIVPSCEFRGLSDQFIRVFYCGKSACRGPRLTRFYSGH